MPSSGQIFADWSDGALAPIRVIGRERRLADSILLLLRRPRSARAAAVKDPS